MGLLEACRSLAVSFLAVFSTPSLHADTTFQKPLSEHLASSVQAVNFPRFQAPGSPERSFKCEYPGLSEHWKPCSTKYDRSCWMKHNETGEEYNLKTDYELVDKTPPGVNRTYHLKITNGTLSPDGIANPGMKLFNDDYPGPLIEACWGDWIEVTVRNELPCNGTTIHWHGIRQLNSVIEDGVNGVTQCPIAPNSESTYRFRAMQYGTTWYHSHYSLQYADGLAGPMTIYGPSSAPYDDQIEPLLITDWSHRSAFEDWHRELTGEPSIPKMNSVLINGQGNFAGATNKSKFNWAVEKGKKYLMRIINTSVDTTYIFSIDNHNFTVISSDFVPIEPYNTTRITVGIGQRYHIILHAAPIPSNAKPGYPGWLSSKGNYWIRTIPATGCNAFEQGNTPDERQGIIRYNPEQKDPPVSWRTYKDLTCQDEPYNSLTPIKHWNIDRTDLPSPEKWFAIGFDGHKGRPDPKDDFDFWTMGNDPMWLNFGQPTLLDVDQHFGNEPWDNSSAVIELEDRPWIFMVITMNKTVSNVAPGRTFYSVAHPIHLHGHDFALVAQGTNQTDLKNATLLNSKLRLKNPPRRDVALLPASGYLIIAFQNDNPGMWLVHCHIAWHASSGLAVQLLERKKDLWKQLTERPETLRKAKQECAVWNDWYKKNEKTCALPPAHFQDDSGI